MINEKNDLRDQKKAKFEIGCDLKTMPVPSSNNKWRVANVQEKKEMTASELKKWSALMRSYMKGLFNSNLKI